MTKNTGGSAFPIWTEDMNVEGGPGMTLRQWYAGQVIAGLYASHDGSTRENMVAEAFTIADAMIAEGNKP